ncbi:acyl-CoA desaturase [Anoplophora glabripennis]|uniref:acyl-CoA desaturase n=1 Tax=Anoplophora glabripennis TaxID=217634 RepID=UPI000875A872|nr:acyl-CoA desaturase [Anoplophora glabripennis]
MSSEVNKAEKDETLSLSREINWLKVLFQIQITLSALCALHFLLYESYWSTVFFTIFLTFLGHMGVAAGAHRLWAHRSYTATGALRLFLLLCQTMSGTGTIYDWVRWHRLHHKHFGTDLDPFNPNRGWFYAHVHSVALRLSPAQEKALEEIDMTDIEAEKMVMFQKKWYPLLYLIFVLLLPINAPAEYWGESLYASLFLVGWFRYAFGLQLAWLIHSATKIWGLQPGEKYPCDTNLVFILTKSNWLSYHYLAPWDYQTSEYGQYGNDTVTKFIRICAALELATDLRTVDSKTVREALTRSVVEKKDITQCLLELSKDANLQPDHYLNPQKYS